MIPEPVENSFYWQTARDELLTATALRMFQIAAKHDGEDFDLAKDGIDQEYELAQGRGRSQRHGGNFQTHVRVFEEAGWMYVETQEDKKFIRVTDAGRQALQLFFETPDFLKAIPYFMIELLSRYQLNNPSGPSIPRRPEVREAKTRSNVFPYWTLWKIMRSLDNYITIDELRRFVFRLQRSEDIDLVISNIKEYRQDVGLGLGEEQLNTKYNAPLTGAISEPKYIMARAGVHVGTKPPLIFKPDQSTFQLEAAYLPFIDQIIANEPIFKEYLDADTWFRDYGQPVLLEEEYAPFSLSVLDPDAQLKYEEVPDDDPIWKKVEELLRIGIRNILFYGPPATSKTTYALNIGAKIAEYQPHRFRNIQFHQSLGYEDFVQGYVPSESSSGGSFVIRPKTFLQACEAALRSNPEKLHVLVIDELNRGDPSRIFGDTLTYIERRNEPFILEYSGERAIVPSNLVILATLNPYDKSITDLDDAMYRRFSGKIEMRPDKDLLRKILVDVNHMDVALAGRVVGFFDHLTRELNDRIGHAYFKDARDYDSLQTVWEYSILPVLDRELKHDAEALKRIEDEFNQSVTQPNSSKGVP